MGADGGHIHPRAAVAQACRRAHGAGPDAGGEAIVEVVGPGYGLVEVGEWRDKDDGAEDSRRTISSACKAPATTVGR